MITMFSTHVFDNHQRVAKRLFRPSFLNFDRSPVRALAGGLLLAALFPTLALAAPVTVDVTVTGSDGNPVSAANVTVTQAGPQPGNPAAVSGSATTGANGTASVSNGTVLPANTPQPLPAGVYQVDVTVGDVHTTTYVHVPEGQTGTTNIDLGTATTENARGQSYSDAARDAAVANQFDNEAAYDAAVARIDEIIEFREQAIEDLESAIEDYAEANDIRATTPDDAKKMRRRIGRLQEKRPDLVDPAQVAKLDEYIGLLNLLEIWRGVLRVTQATRDEIPSFSYLPWAEADEDSEYAGLNRPFKQPEIPGVATNRAASYRVNVRIHPHQF